MNDPLKFEREVQALRIDVDREGFRRAIKDELAFCAACDKYYYPVVDMMPQSHCCRGQEE